MLHACTCTCKYSHYPYSNCVCQSDSENLALREWVHNLRLTMADKEILQSGRWLTANHIQAVNKLLRQMFPGQNGLQDTHQLSVKQTWDCSPDNFVQIIFVEHGHWACLSNVFSDRSDTIELFDSMHTIPTAEGSIGQQACCIAKSAKSELCIDVIGVQMQACTNDCGLFAISMAYDLCRGIDPFTQEVIQDDMRAHLLSCFEEERMTPFPRVAGTLIGRNRIVNSVCFELYCICRRPEFGLMAQCNQCCQWFHRDCVHIPDEVISNEDLPWDCPSCELLIYK